MDHEVSEKRVEFRPETGEAPFEAGEVFYSRTDRRGVIESGNYIFKRVAGYSWDELIGAPHKIIRHKDMPKGVFWLLWDRILNGKVTGAYVKNCAKDGLHYWVFAIIAPMGEGFLSARIKPTSELLAKVEELYASMLTAEGEGHSPEESAGFLLDKLNQLGFEDYEDFMSHACSEELKAECKVLELPPNDRVAQAGRNLKIASALSEKTHLLVEAFEAASIVPRNLQLTAARLEPSGGPISTLSRNYGETAAEMSRWFVKHVLASDSDFHKIRGRIKKAMVLECAAGVLNRCDLQLQAERRELGPTNLNTERKLLSQLAAQYIDGANEATLTVYDEAARIASTCEDLKRELTKLSITRVACKIENARYSPPIAGLEDVIRQFGETQKIIEEYLNAIMKDCSLLVDEKRSDSLSREVETSDTLLYGAKMAAALEKPANFRE